MAKNVRISEELYRLLVDYHLGGNQSAANQIRILLEDKEERRKRRALYQTMHDSGRSAEDRSAAKELYQDSLGVPDDFRY